MTQDSQDKDKIWKVVTQQFLRVFSRKSKQTKLIQFFTLKLRTVYDVTKDKFQGQKRVRAIKAFVLKNIQYALWLP